MMTTQTNWRIATEWLKNNTTLLQCEIRWIDELKTYSCRIELRHSDTISRYDGTGATKAQAAQNASVAAHGALYDK